MSLLNKVLNSLSLLNSGRVSSSAFTYGALLMLWGLLVLLVPQISLLLLLINLMLMLGLAGLQFYSALLVHSSGEVKEKSQQEAFISIHVPTYNEPAAVVINTIKALQKLQYSNFEVIVLDNNTPDPAVWQPVAQYCARLDKRFRFRHMDKLEGYKAGALNVCYKMSDPRTEYILVIDADYEVAEHLLLEASKYFIDESVALVQFPQAYSNTGPANRAMESEYNHFFEVYMNMANQYNCVLSTGTVSMIRKEALEQVGLWSGSTITEDCELGLRLHQHGYRGVYVPKSLGKGLMPTDLKALKVQRERWVFGNMQTLLKFLRLPKHKLMFSQCIGIFTQLTAWFNFLILPVLAAASGMLAYALLPRPEWLALGVVGILSVCLHLLLKLLFFRVAFRKQPRPWQSAAGAYLVHLGMAWEGAVSWLRALLGENIRFKRTNKFLIKPDNIDVSANLLMGLLLLIAAGSAFFAGAYLWGSLALLAAPPFGAVLYLKKITERTHALSKHLAAQVPAAKAA